MTRNQELSNSARTPKFAKTLLLLVGILLSFASLIYAHDPQYNEQNYSFRAGYSAGYGHGTSDQRSRTNFDFRHDRAYQTESRNSYNNVSQQDLNFRLGYVEGYADGYFRQNPLIELPQQQQHHQYNENYHQDYRSPDQGGITVFTDTSFLGYSRSFGIGQYSSLEGRLDDDIESIRVNDGLRVVLFENDKFKGKSIVIERDAWDLGNFKRKAGSMIIEPIRRY